ncbi:MAG: hypothetical protein PVF55_02990 [Desulfobacterales bacterium]|jgi:hypothetical protein
MKKLLTCKRMLLLAIILIAALLIGCGSGNDLPVQVSGTWQRAQGEGSVEINLAKEPLFLNLDGKTFPTSIKSVDTGSYAMHLNVETEPGQFEEWILRQVWDDNGSSFTLSLNHNGTNENLVSGQRS